MAADKKLLENRENCINPKQEQTRLLLTEGKRVGYHRYVSRETLKCFSPKTSKAHKLFHVKQ